MKFSDNLPIYIQIINLIKKRIVIEELKEGEKLPSVRELSTELKVNPNTIQRSYQELEREGLVFTKRGMGTFVTKEEDLTNKLKNNMASTIINNFILEMKALGFDIKKMIDLINEREKEEK